MTKKGHSLTIILLLIPGVGFITVLLMACFAMVILQSLGLYNFTGESIFGFQQWIASLNQQNLDSFIYSTEVAFLSSFISLIIAYPLAMQLRTNFFAKKYVNLVIRMPLFVPALVAAFLILNVFSYQGIVNEVLMFLGIIKEPLRMTHDQYGLGVVAIQIWKNLPFQALILSAALASIQDDLESAAKNLGAGRWSIFRDILFPLSISGALTAFVFVFIGVFGDYAINQTSGPKYPPSLAMRMYMNAKLLNDWGQSACIAVMIMVGALVYAWFFSRMSKVVAG
jgi:putative spermidine/putrescine transport system permease protein